MQEIRTAGEYLIEHVKDTEATKGRTVLVLRATQTIYLHYMSKGLMYSGASNLEDLKKSLLDISQDLINIMGKAKERI
jgi:translation initiation factor eIF-2B subunit alpha